MIKMAMEHLLDGRFLVDVPEKSAKSLQASRFGRKEPHDGPGVGDQLAVLAEIIEVLPVPHHRHHGSRTHVKELRGSSGLFWIGLRAPCD